jgi:hypothetical protein
MCWFCERSCGTRYVSLLPPDDSAHGEGGDLPGRGQIALLQRRRHAEHVGDVVEAVGRVVWRQQRRHVDVERQQVADGVLVLRAIQPVQHRPPGIGTAERLAIERRLQPRHQTVGRLGVRAARPFGRHHARAHLADDLLPQVRVLRDPGQIGRIEGEAARLQPLVVTAHAVAVDDRPELLGRIGHRRRGLRLAPGRHAGRRTLCGEHRAGEPQAAGEREGSSSHGPPYRAPREYVRWHRPEIT